MKKQIWLGMVTLLVTIPVIAQIKVDESKNNPNQIYSGPSGSGFEYYLPFIEYHGFEMKPYYDRPKGFQGILILRPQNDKAPAWLKYEELNNKKRNSKTDSSKIIQ